jgi:hypothetical protein
MAISDQRGDGRPDFNYQARILYADSVAPSAVGSAGGTVTITGMGFRPGNTVLVNGVAANVSNWTANTIVARVPSLHTLGVSTALLADVTVKDLSTGGTTVMTHALSYAAPANTLNLLSAPSGSVAVGQPATVPFTVQIVQGDGVTPVVGEQVTFSAAGGSVLFAACGTGTCAMQTDSRGIASTVVTPQSAGAITVQAAAVDGTANSSFVASLEARTATAVQPVEYVAAGSTVSWTPQVSVTDNIASTAGAPIVWQAISGAVAASPANSAVNGQGVAETLATVGPVETGGQAVLSACAWITVCARFTMQGVDPAQLQISAVSGAGQVITANGTFAPIVLRVTDASFDPVAGAIVQIYQTVDAWQIPCPDQGRCPIPPVLASSESSIASDANGLVTVTPQQVPGVAGTTNFAAVTGSQGFVSLSLEKEP